LEWARQHADGTLNKIKVSYNETSEIEAARQDAVCTTERTTRWRACRRPYLHGRARGRRREAADRVLVSRLHARVGAGRGDHKHELHGRRLRG